MIDQIVQVSGSLMILTAFLLLQLHRLQVSSYVYIGLNLVGSIILAINAFILQSWGFFLLETVWAIVSTISLLNRHRKIKMPTPV